MNAIHAIRRTIWLAAMLGTTVALAQPALTIYNQDFAVVRDTLALDLKAGENTVSITDTTVHLEPDSVILRDPAGRVPLRILEQNFRADPVSEGLLLSLFEGKTIDFRIQEGDQVRVAPGKVIRSGYVPHQTGLRRYGQQYQMTQMAYAGAQPGGQQPIIEIEGRLRFGLPGTPLFPSLGDDSILKPTLLWRLEAAEAARLEAELSYVTGGMSWEADYNLVSPERGDTLDLVGWVTMDNQSGKTFEQARIKLMAGDVSRVRQDEATRVYSAAGDAFHMKSAAPAVTERTFDEYHLYTLERPATLHDRETKQVEFVRAAGIQSKTLYIYDGADVSDNQYRGWAPENIRDNPQYGSKSNPKIWVMREFKNSKENNLGMPLPKGRLRFYRQDEQGKQLEFTGENVIDHTAADELVRVYTGNAFDLTGERRQTHFQVNNSEHWAEESFEIKVRNHKKTPIDVRVVEHLYRWHNWKIIEKSQEYKKTDSRTIEFPVTIAPDQSATITYKVHYSW